MDHGLQEEEMAPEHQDVDGRFHLKVDYDTDFYAWAQAQAEALRAKDWAAVDVTNLLEEVEGLAERHRSAIEHQLERLLIHLLKYQYQPDERPRRGRGWRVSIASARHEIMKVIQRNPSLQAYPAACLANAYRYARRQATLQTDLPLATFPEACPWPIEQVLDEDFWPEG
jgi:Domain of unknown function DUF29